MEQFSIEAERVLIGSGAHCDVRLAIDQAAPEHVLLELVGNTIGARALATEPPPMIDRAPFTHQPIGEDAILTIGQTQLRVAVVGIGTSRGGKKKKGAVSPVTILAGLLIVVGGVVWFLGDTKEPTALSRMPNDFPDLFAAPQTTCPQRGNKIAALGSAKDNRERAEAKRERRPFRMRDGVDAVPLYELAAACYTAADEKQTSEESLAVAQALRKEINDDYRVHRVRLERALTPPTNERLAAREVQVLLSITENRDPSSKPSKYVQWLSEQDRTLRLKLGKTATK